MLPMGHPMGHSMGCFMAWDVPWAGGCRPMGQPIGRKRHMRGPTIHGIEHPTGWHATTLFTTLGILCRVA